MLEGDGDLARRVAAGDPGAEADLCRRFGPRVRLFARRHLRDEQAAADLAQDVLVMTLESLRAGKLRDPDRLASFVLGTARLVALDVRRGQRRRERLLSEFGPDLREAMTPAPAPAIDGQRLATCVGQLAERDRTVILLSFYGEHTSEQIAAELSMSPGNVRVVRHRALARLADCMGVEGAP